MSLRSAQRPHGLLVCDCVVPLCMAVRGIMCQRRGMKPGREPRGAVSWSALAAQVLHLASWGLLLSDLLAGGEEPHVQ